VNTGSAAAAEWAKDQIMQCKELHKGCNYQQESPLPDRVLAIGHTGFGSPTSEDWLESPVRLLETSGEQSAYATLSHRWGEHQPIRLLLSNVEEFKNNIPWSALPKTFQDAIVFARRLEIPYIWIDSLCIIQDSKVDWSIQSGKMAGIYEYSTITLAATVATGGTAGCFIQPSPEMIGFITSGQSKLYLQNNSNSEETSRQLRTSSSNNPAVFIRGLPSHTVPGFATNQDFLLPLLQRGWVYQERLLSPRILHFGSHDLSFECNSDIHCYCDNERRVISQRIPTAWARPPKEMHAHRLLAEKDAYESGMRWMKIVEEYTSLDLTFGTDKLPAIAGVAKQFRRCLSNTRYLAGLWEECLVDLLLWERNRRIPHTGVRVADAPSWSWVSVPGPVQYDRATYMQDAVNRPTVEKVVYESDNGDEYMVLRQGRITLNGHIVKARLRMLKTTSETTYGIVLPGTKGFKSMHLDFDPTVDELRKDWRRVSPKWERGLLNESGDKASSLPGQELPEDEDMDDTIPLRLYMETYESAKQYARSIFFITMGTLRDRNGGIYARMLVLELVENTEQLYKRVGHCICMLDSPLLLNLGSRQSFTLV
jgi:hypothetical protein